MLVDTHCHLHFDAFDADREAVIERAQAAGVTHLVNVGTDPATNQAAFALAGRYPFMSSTVGLHPHHAHEISDPEFESLKTFVREHRPAAIGEIGLDYYKSEADAKTQKKVFSKMLRLALENDLPVIVHSRNAFQDTADLIRQETGDKIKGVMHCFSYDKPCLKKLLDLGFLASFTCNLTFKNAAELLEVARFAPMDRIMLETDSPYLAPQIHRGKRNEPAYLVHLARFLAEKRGMPLKQFEDATSGNAARFFGISLNHD